MSEREKPSRVGFAGLGNLGLPMASAIADAGWPLTVYDIRREPVGACAALGATGAEAVGDLAECEILALAVPDDDAVRGILQGDGLLDALGDDALVVVHSTLLPATARQLGEAAAARGISYVDGPVSGGAERARKGTLTVMAGATDEALLHARAYLDTVSSDVFHVGRPGAGSAAKLANQLMMLAALAGTHEALALAEAYDVAREDVLRAVQTSTGDSWVARSWGFFDEVAAAYDAAGTPVPYRPWSKDLWDVVAAARAADVPVPFAGLLAQSLADVVERHAHRARP